MPQPPHPSPVPGLRLNKALAQAGLCSRRAADALIAAGRVTVNGRAPTGLGMTVDPAADAIAVDGKSVVFPAREVQAYFLLHKPPQVVTTAKDPMGRPTVLSLMGREANRVRLFPIGRLDYFSEGLLLLTSDGELANRLMHPRWHLPKVYLVTVRGRASHQALETMRRGMVLTEGERLAPVRVAEVSSSEGASVLEMELIQGVNRQIRRMCRDLGLTILQLKRVRQGPIALGELPSGHYRPLTPGEVAALKAAVGLC